MFTYNVYIIYRVIGNEASRIGANLIMNSSGVSLKCPALQTGSVLFFVNKGDEIELECNSELRKDSGTVMSNTLAWYTTDTGNRTTYNYDIVDFQVY